LSGALQTTLFGPCIVTMVVEYNGNCVDLVLV
jgi:hypothetical protein